MAEASIESGQAKIQSFTNQQLFDELEKNGYQIEDVFTKEEIEFYKAEDRMRAGKTQFVDHGDGTSTLYLSSAYTKTISILGGSAATTIAALAGGAVPAGLAAMLSGMISENLQTDKGTYINFKSQKDAAGEYVLTSTGWGYQ
ncbi:hypothetical protein [Staphylococcus rostri]|uniref:Uncharacterized protein n=1 Tax=Staphylococcus rostri TaxID=522262 RepID=A0A2K3YTZ8_9STAP|nr:hypothetical protein [Staphylococcus rostri]PNZ29070.1 hypothetical protein CD122_02765 [Staphylococcus rostri]